MADLLDSFEPPRDLRRGELVEGHVVRVEPSGILVSVGNKSEGFVPAEEMRTLTPDFLKRMPSGSSIKLLVLNPYSSDGQALLSLDRAREINAWDTLEEAFEKGLTVEGVITGFNSGGAVIDIDGAQGFVPLSQLGLPNRSGEETGKIPTERIGQRVTLKVLETNRRRGRAVLSERALLKEKQESAKDRLFDVLQEGDIRKGKVTSVSNFGAFVDLGGADGLIHVSEMSWMPVSRVEDVIKVGDEVEVYVLKIDRESRRIALSLRRLQRTPWELAVERYQPGQLVTGTITKLMDFGAFARVDNIIEGLVHISELTDKFIRHPKEVVQIGDTMTLRIITMDPERRRLGLSLKKVEEHEVVSSLPNAQHGPLGTGV